MTITKTESRRKMVSVEDTKKQLGSLFNFITCYNIYLIVLYLLYYLDYLPFLGQTILLVIGSFGYSKKSRALLNIYVVFQLISIVLECVLIFCAINPGMVSENWLGIYNAIWNNAMPIYLPEDDLFYFLNVILYVTYLFTRISSIFGARKLADLLKRDSETSDQGTSTDADIWVNEKPMHYVTKEQIGSEASVTPGEPSTPTSSLDQQTEPHTVTYYPNVNQPMDSIV